MRNVPLSVVVVVLSLVFMGCGGTQTPPAGLTVSAPAPDITLKTLDGAPIDLATLQAQGPLVYIQLRGWVGYQCPLCTKQVGDVLSHAKDFEAAGAEVVLAYPGPAAEIDARASEFIAGKDFPANIHFLLDPDLAAVNALGLRWDAPKETAYPAALILRDGKVAFSKISDSHGGRAGAEELLAALK